MGSVWIKKMKGCPPDNQVIIFTWPESFQVVRYFNKLFLTNADKKHKAFNFLMKIIL